MSSFAFGAALVTSVTSAAPAPAHGVAHAVLVKSLRKQGCG
jgi:hypothetical protein